MPSAGTTAPAKSSLSRYLVVTIVATPANVLAISLLLAFTNWPSLLCNLVAATVVTIPSFIVCSRWVWTVEGQSSRRAVVFWTTSVVNVSAASMALWLLESRGAPGPVLAITPFAVYTALWFTRFAFLDRVVFRSSTLATSELLLPATDR
jgi:putative flippase GtrA